MPPFANLWYAPIAPVLRHQGRKVRNAMPFVPEARGPEHGEFAGEAPGLQVLVLGESTVAGVGVEHTDEALPALLAGELSQRSGKAVSWQAFGRSGATVEDNDEQLARVEAKRKELANVDLAVIVMGVSDTISFTTPRRFFARMDCLIMRLRLLLWPMPVLLAGVPRLERFRTRLPRPLRDAMARRCRSLDRALMRVAQDGYQVLHWPSLQPPGVQQAPGAFALDGFHPGPEGYRLWARHLGLGAVTLLENVTEKADLRDTSALDI